MKRFLNLSALAMALIAACLVWSAPASAQAGARIHLIHGIPDTPVDVAAGGENVIEGFEFGGTEDLSSFAGQTLTGVQVKLAGTDDVAIDAGDLALPASGNVTAIAHLDAAGTPTLTVFENDTAPTAAGQGRLVVRHTAAAPAVDVLANGTPAFTNLSNPNEAKADLPAGTISASVVPTGETEPVVIGPADLPVTDGSSLIVYAVGSLDGGNLQTLTETIDGLGSSPGAVNTGNSPVSDGSSAGLWLVLAASSRPQVVCSSYAGWRHCRLGAARATFPRMAPAHLVATAAMVVGAFAGVGCATTGDAPAASRTEVRRAGAGPTRLNVCSGGAAGGQISPAAPGAPAATTHSSAAAPGPPHDRLTRDRQCCDRPCRGGGERRDGDTRSHRGRLVPVRSTAGPARICSSRRPHRL